MPSKKAPNLSASALQPRRKPVQARSAGTVMLIFQAAAHLLQRDGIESFNTNQVANKAGISIGSLYQYFPNKEALLIAMAEFEMQQVAQDVRHTVQRCQSNPSLDLEFEVARTLIAKLGTRFRVRRILCELAVRFGRSDVLQAPLLEADQTLKEKGLATRPIERFVITSAVQGIIKNLTAVNSPWLNDPDLPLEVARMIKAYRLVGQAYRSEKCLT